jgi:arginyl-tRNA--protein-N-Asp/Glu arginylyltransferase
MLPTKFSTTKEQLESGFIEKAEIVTRLLKMRVEESSFKIYNDYLEGRTKLVEEVDGSKVTFSLVDVNE